MTNADVFADFIKSIEARATSRKGVDKQAYGYGYLQAFLQSNMDESKVIIDRMVAYTKGNFEEAGRAV